MLTNFEHKCQVAVLEQQIMIKKQGGECWPKKMEGVYRRLLLWAACRL